jgi:hypothetical protein
VQKKEEDKKKKQKRQRLQQRQDPAACQNRNHTHLQIKSNQIIQRFTGEFQFNETFIQSFQSPTTIIQGGGKQSSLALLHGPSSS